MQGWYVDGLCRSTSDLEWFRADYAQALVEGHMYAKAKDAQTHIQTFPSHQGRERQARTHQIRERALAKKQT
jgi:hypothetical protein